MPSPKQKSFTEVMDEDGAFDHDLHDINGSINLDFEKLKYMQKDIRKKRIQAISRYDKMKRCIGDYRRSLEELVPLKKPYTERIMKMARHLRKLEGHNHIEREISQLEEIAERYDMDYTVAPVNMYGDGLAVNINFPFPTDKMTLFPTIEFEVERVAKIKPKVRRPPQAANLPQESSSSDRGFPPPGPPPHNPPQIPQSASTSSGMVERGQEQGESPREDNQLQIIDLSLGRAPASSSNAITFAAAAEAQNDATITIMNQLMMDSPIAMYYSQYLQKCMEQRVNTCIVESPTPSDVEESERVLSLAAKAAGKVVASCSSSSSLTPHADKGVNDDEEGREYGGVVRDGGSDDSSVTIESETSSEDDVGDDGADLENFLVNDRSVADSSLSYLPSAKQKEEIKNLEKREKNKKRKAKEEAAHRQKMMSMESHTEEEWTIR